MRHYIIQYLKQHPVILDFAWKNIGCLLKILSYIIPFEKKTIMFCSFGGRKFDDSPKALYDEICKREDFKDWRIIWAFVNPNDFNISRGEKVKIDTPSFFKALLKSRVWISNSGMTRGVEFKRKNVVRVETWHGTPLKKIGGEENTNSMLKYRNKKNTLDDKTIRCAQSVFDRNIFARIWNASPDKIILSDLPRNDSLFHYTQEDIMQIKKTLGISKGKKIILYTPTYREYLIDENKNNFIAPPIDLDKWENRLSSEFVLLIRAHYAVSAALNIKENDFIKDVSGYPILNDLYIISDMMISDYSSTYFDFSILNRPMYCFAYDRREYEEKRGLYLNLDTDLPCSIDVDEDSLINHILTTNIEEACDRSKAFHLKYAPYAGGASKVVVDEVLKQLSFIKAL